MMRVSTPPPPSEDEAPMLITRSHRFSAVTVTLVGGDDVSPRERTYAGPTSVRITRVVPENSAKYATSPTQCSWVCPVMSRQHARITFGDSGQVYLTDLASHHGTTVARATGQVLALAPNSRVPLEHGDILTFGKTVVKGRIPHDPVVARISIRAAIPPVQQDAIKISPGRYGLFDSDSSSSDSSDREDYPPLPVPSRLLNSSPPAGTKKRHTDKADSDMDMGDSDADSVDEQPRAPFRLGLPNFSDLSFPPSSVGAPRQGGGFGRLPRIADFLRFSGTDPKAVATGGEIDPDLADFNEDQDFDEEEDEDADDDDDDDVILEDVEAVQEMEADLMDEEESLYEFECGGGGQGSAEERMYGVWSSPVQQQQQQGQPAPIKLTPINELSLTPSLAPSLDVFDAALLESLNAAAPFTVECALLPAIPLQANNNNINNVARDDEAPAASTAKKTSRWVIEDSEDEDQLDSDVAPLVVAPAAPAAAPTSNANASGNVDGGGDKCAWNELRAAAGVRRDFLASESASASSSDDDDNMAEDEEEEEEELPGRQPSFSVPVSSPLPKDEVPPALRLQLETLSRGIVDRSLPGRQPSFSLSAPVSSLPPLPLTYEMPPALRLQLETLSRGVVDRSLETETSGLRVRVATLEDCMRRRTGEIAEARREAGEETRDLASKVGAVQEEARRVAHEAAEERGRRETEMERVQAELDSAKKEVEELKTALAGVQDRVATLEVVPEPASRKRKLSDEVDEAESPLPVVLAPRPEKKRRLRTVLRHGAGLAVGVVATYVGLAFF